MTPKISPKIGIILNWKPEDFDLNTANERIKRKKKYAWGTGGVVNKPEENELPGKILGLFKRSRQNNILYGAIIDLKNFDEYLGTQRSEIKQLKGKHKEYRPDWLTEKEGEFDDKAILFISKVFILKDPIQSDKIKVWNGNGKTFSSGHRSAVFIDLKTSNIDPNKILANKRDFDSFINNPFVQTLGYKEDGLTNAFTFLLRNYRDIANEFFKLSDINNKPSDFEIRLREKIKKSKRRNHPDMKFIWGKNDSEIYVEAKLDASVNKNQLDRYSKNGKVICITRGGKKKRLKKRLIKMGKGLHLDIGKKSIE